jgi:hypothetical protein
VGRFFLSCLLGAALTAGVPAGPFAAELAITVEAPAALETTAERIRSLDPQPLVDALAGAGLDPPPDIQVTLIAEDDPRARATPDWIVGLASGSRHVAIFPARIGAYPYGSLEAVLWHEVVHLALNARADGRRLPRWFHEGVAVTVEGGWNLTSQLRLVLAAGGDPALGDLSRLFGSESQPETARAYLLAAALMADVRRRHGPAVPGAIAGRVAAGAPFAEAFRLETGEGPEDAAARTWRAYRRWTSWLPVVASGATLWSGILVLAVVAFLVRLQRRARRRRQWDEDDDLPDA